MDADPHISSAHIAKEAGVTPGRVRQILRLTRLDPSIQTSILALRGEVADRQYPERFLRTLIVLPPDEQVERMVRFHSDSFG